MVEPTMATANHVNYSKVKGWDAFSRRRDFELSTMATTKIRRDIQGSLVDLVGSQVTFKPKEDHEVENLTSK